MSCIYFSAWWFGWRLVSACPASWQKSWAWGLFQYKHCLSSYRNCNYNDKMRPSYFYKGNFYIIKIMFSYWNSALFPSKGHLLRYRHSRYKYKVVMRPSYVWNANVCTSKMVSLYWNSPQIFSQAWNAFDVTDFEHVCPLTWHQLRRLITAGSLYGIVNNKRRIAHSLAGAKIEHRSYFEITKDTSYLTFKGEL